MFYERSACLSGDRQPSNNPRWGNPAVDEWENEGGGLLTQSTQVDVASATGNVVREDHSQTRFALFDAMPVGVLVCNVDGEISYCNRASQTLLGVDASQLLGVHWHQIVDVRDRASIPGRCQEISRDSQPCLFEARLVSSTGRRFWSRYRIAGLGSGQMADGHVHTIEDISAIKAAEQIGKATCEALSQAGESARLALEGVGDAVISTDAKGRVVYLNPVAEALTGWSRQAACGHPFSQVFRLIDSGTGQPVDNPVADAVNGDQHLRLAEHGLLLRLDGSELAVEQSVVPIRDLAQCFVGAVVIFRDRRLSTECMARMAHLARHDELTGLHNRVALSEHFEQALNLARRHHSRVGLLFIDLDSFKQINDNLGHKAGDRVLRTFAHRLTACVRSTDLVCRYGGDEFVVLLSEIGRADDAAKVAGMIYESAAKAVHYQGHVINLELSIGISLFPDHGENADALMRRADAAMYQAKLEGCQQHCFYQAGMHYPLPGSGNGVSPGNGANVSHRTDGHGANGR